jgi:hypothetical protein
MKTQILLTAAALALVGACGGGGSTPNPTPTLSPTPTTAPTPTPTASSTPTPEGSAPLRVGSLQPGRYHTNVFDPQVTFTLGSGWMNLFADDNDEVALERSGPAFLGFSRATQVVAADGQVMDAPEDLVGWLSEHRAHDVRATRPTEIAGLAGTVLEVDVKAASNMDVFAFPTGNFHVAAGDRAHYYVLELDGPDLTIVAMGSQATFDAEVLPLIEAVLASLEVDASP